MKFHYLILLLLANLTRPAAAQLCTGSLGDPVVNITFGSGSGPGQPLPPGVTSYTFVPNTCPNDGSYTITDLSFGCFNSAWHTVSGDHTPNDASGKYMLINASLTAGDFYVDTIRGLCANTNYEFAAWVKNVLKPSSVGIMPNLTFKVESLTGLVLTTVNSGNIASEDPALWKQYGAYFITPPGITDVVIRLSNNAPGGNGNDFALDDITFRPCGPKIDATVDNTDTSFVFGCESDRKSYLLKCNYTPGVYANPSFQWQESSNGVTWTNIPGANNNTYLRPPGPKGQYFYRMLMADGPNINSISCRLASNTITLAITQPDAQVTNYVFGCYGKPIGLFAAGGSFYSWTGPNGFRSDVQDPRIERVQFENTGWYTVKVTDYNGCVDYDSTNLIVYPAANVAVSPPVSICEGSSTTITGSGGTRYSWAPAKGLNNDTIPNPVASPTETTVYKLVIFNQYGCFDTASVRVNVWKKPQADAGPDQKTRIGYPAVINGNAKGTDVTWFWTPPATMDNPNALRTKVNPPQSQTYTLHVVSTHGCGEATDNVFVRVYEKLEIPNAFSPNGDGINDTWIIEPLEFFPESVTTIYNRYGKPIYTSKGYAKPWDGRVNGNPVPVGMYYYVIDLKNPREPLVTGSVLIIR